MKYSSQFVTPPVFGLPISATKNIVPKGWGKEIWIANYDKYCAKILSFETGKKFSYHYHVNKEESWYFYSGKFYIKIGHRDGRKERKFLYPGDRIHIYPGVPHQLLCLEAGDVFEVSTTHEEKDSFRIEKGD